MTIFNVIHHSVVDCVSTISIYSFVNERKAQDKVKSIWENVKSQLTGVKDEPVTDADFDAWIEYEGWEEEPCKQGFDIYESGYASHNSENCYIQETELA